LQINKHVVTYKTKCIAIA